MRVPMWCVLQQVVFMLPPLLRGKGKERNFLFLLITCVWLFSESIKVEHNNYY